MSGGRRPGVPDYVVAGDAIAVLGRVKRVKDVRLWKVVASFFVLNRGILISYGSGFEESCRGCSVG